MALNLTGQLTIGDANNIGNNSNYIKLDIDLFETQSGALGNFIKSEAIIVKVAIWKSKASYNAGKPALQSYGAQVVNEIVNQYTIDSTTILTAPQANFNAILGKSIYDKLIYWVHQQVLAQIQIANPTFTGAVVDIQL